MKGVDMDGLEHATGDKITKIIIGPAHDEILGQGFFVRPHESKRAKEVGMSWNNCHDHIEREEG